MNDLCAEAAFYSYNKYGEQLCGDHIDDVTAEDGSRIIVLADGLGSGVKANILSTLTAKIISTMMAAGMDIDECVQTVISTLPVCSERLVAYSTFTIIRLVDNDEAEIIEYDNPPVIMLRDGKSCELHRRTQIVEEKTIGITRIKLQENDLLVAMSDGCLYAGVGLKLNFGWERDNIVDFLEHSYDPERSATSVNTELLDECYRLYGEKPGDDTTALTIRIRRRRQVNLLIGPPSNPVDSEKMMSLFFSKQGRHIVCGGTTSTIAARYLGKPLVPQLLSADREIPPTASVEGIDLVTEGVITMNKVLSYAKDRLDKNDLYIVWSNQNDGASQIARMLFDEATDINFYVGRAVNPAHQNPALPINFNIKMQLVDELSKCLRSMGKSIKVSYF